MSAIRLARGFTGRDKIIKFDGCYHGHADSLLVKAGSGALTLGHPDSAGVPAAFTQHTIVLPFNDTDAVKAVIDGYHSALSALDVQKMDGLWAHDPYVVLINPRDKGISVGWDAVKKNWDATFAAWSELKVTQQDGPHIHVNGNVAWASGIALAAGKLKNGRDGKAG